MNSLEKPHGLILKPQESLQQDQFSLQNIPEFLEKKTQKTPLKRNAVKSYIFISLGCWGVSSLQGEVAVKVTIIFGEQKRQRPWITILIVWLVSLPGCGCTRYLTGQLLVDQRLIETSILSYHGKRQKKISYRKDLVSLFLCFLIG